MRIIAGRFRHRVLLASPGLVTRPITDRVKESLFARIEHLLPGARVADVFAGSGTLGLEALSRGAASAVFFEQDRKALEALRKNIAALGVENESLCWRVDVWRTSFHPLRAETFLPYDIVFFDPPYKMADDLSSGAPLGRALQRLVRPAVSAEHALLIVRVPEHSHPRLPSVWQVESNLIMSNMELLLCRPRRTGDDGPEDRLVDGESTSMIHPASPNAAAGAPGEAPDETADETAKGFEDQDD